MGADLYIKKLSEPLIKANSGAFERAVRERNEAWEGAEAEISRKQLDKIRNWLAIEDFDLAEKKPVVRGPAKKWLDIIRAANEKVHQHYDAMYSEGYFRDSYNATSVLWAYNLSWWGDVTPMLNKRGNLTPARAKEFLALLEMAKLKPVTKKSLKANHATVDDGENSPAQWKKYFREKRESLIAFLKLAIKLRTSIRCSL